MMADEVLIGWSGWDTSRQEVLVSQGLLNTTHEKSRGQH